MKINLENKTALITASTKGIGLSIAKMLFESGAKIIINGRDQETLKLVKNQIEKNNKHLEVETIAADASTDFGVQKIIETYPEIDILINNLGIYEALDFFQISNEKWAEMLQVNLMSGVKLSKYYLKKMIEKNNGRIIFISSEVALMPDPQMIHYSVSKSAMLSLSRGLSELTKNTNVTVNSVTPGPTATDGLKNYIKSLYPDIAYENAEKEFMNRIRPTSLIGRLSKPEEISSLIAYLSSDFSGAINGATIKAEGGTVRSFS